MLFCTDRIVHKEDRGMPAMEMRFNKNDMFLIAGILVAAGVLFCAAVLPRGQAGQSVAVTVDGTLLGTYSLLEDQEIPVQTDYGWNLVVIEGGAVYMEEADCPDGYCIQQGRIASQRSTIICLPHRLVVEVTGESALDNAAQESSQPDAVTY